MEKRIPLVLFILLFVNLSFGIVVKKNVKLFSPPVREIERFGFEDGGTVNFQVTDFFGQKEPENVILLICTQMEFSRLLGNAEIMTDNPNDLCNLNFNLSTTEYSISTMIGTTDNYHLILQNRDMVDLSIEVKYTLLNPSGQLAVGEQLIPMIFQSSVLLWIVVLLFWLGVLFLKRSNTAILHYLVFFCIFLRLIVSINSLVYWNIYQNSGTSFDLLRYVHNFFFSLSETSFFTVLLLTAKGWRITRRGLSGPEMRTVWIAFIILMITLTFFSFYNDGYYFLSLMIMYFFMLPKIFSSMSRNMRALENQSHDLTEEEEAEGSEIIGQRMKIFRRLRVIVLLYLVAILVINSLRIALAWNLEYVNYIADGAATLVVTLLLIAVLFPFDGRVYGARFQLERAQLFDHARGGLWEHDGDLWDSNPAPPPEYVDVRRDVMLIEFPTVSKLSHVPRLSVGVHDQSKYVKSLMD